MLTVTQAVEDEVGPFEDDVSLLACSTGAVLLLLEEDADEDLSAVRVVGWPVESV